MFLLLFSHSVMSNTLQPHGLQHARLLCPSPSPRACSNSCPLSRWCHPTISDTVILFSCLQPFPASGSFPMSQLFATGDQSIGVSASTPVLPKNTQDWFPLGWTGWISLQSKGLKSLLQHNSKASVLWLSAFFMVQLSHPYMTTGKTIALTIWIFIVKVMSLLFNMQSRFVTAFLPRSKHLLTLWLQSPSAVIWEPHCSSLTPSVPAPLVSLLFLEHPFHSHRAFAFAASSDWNALPLPCSLTSFRSLIVNDLIREAFPQHPM